MAKSRSHKGECSPMTMGERRGLFAGVHSTTRATLEPPHRHISSFLFTSPAGADSARLQHLATAGANSARLQVTLYGR